MAANATSGGYHVKHVGDKYPWESFGKTTVVDVNPSKLSSRVFLKLTRLARRLFGACFNRNGIQVSIPQVCCSGAAKHASPFC